jgi:hypothetical protein
MSGTFDAATLTELRDAGTVRIETSRAPEQPQRSAIIWIVVDGGDRVLVRSVRGERGRWYRDLRAHPIGAVVVAGRPVAIRAELADDRERIESCSAALSAKYARSGASLASMLVEDVLHATLELRPA